MVNGAIQGFCPTFHGNIVDSLCPMRDSNTRFTCRGGIVARLKGHVLDRTDMTILSELSKNADVSLRELGQTVGLHGSSCKGRRDFLVARGLMKIRGEIPPEASKWKVVYFMLVKLFPAADKATLATFIAHVTAIPEILSVDEIAGPDYDAILRIEAPSGARFDEIRLSILEAIPGCTAHSISVVRSLKRTSLPPEALLPLDT